MSSTQEMFDSVLEVLSGIITCDRDNYPVSELVQKIASVSSPHHIEQWLEAVGKDPAARKQNDHCNLAKYLEKLLE